MERALPAGSANVAGWIQELPSIFQDAKGGFMAGLMSLALRYFDQFEIAIGNDKEATSMREMLVQRQYLRVLQDGDGDLDQRLYENPKVRKLVVSNLLTVVLVLNTGVSLFANDDKQTLIEETNRILEQASAMAHRHLIRKPICAPVNVVDFCNSIKDVIRSRIDNVYEILPITRQRVQEIGKSERRQSREIGHHEYGPRPDSRITRNPQRLGRPGRSTVTPASNSSSIFQGAQNSCRSHSNSSKPSEKKSYNSTKSPSMDPLFSDTRTHHSAHPSTATVTSFSPSEVGSSSIKPTSNSSRTSSTCKKCRTTFSGFAELEAHLCRTSKIQRFLSVFISWLSRTYSGKVDSQQHVTVWHGNGQSISKKRTIILDSAASDNLIRRSTVEELDHEVTQCRTRRIKGIDGQDVEVNELVQPKWQFKKGSTRHQEITFFVIPEIPGGFDMLLGSVSLTYLGLNFRLDPGYALVVQAHDEEQSTSDQDQEEYGRQRRDGNAEQAKIRQVLEAKHRELFRQSEAANAINAANAAKQTMPQAPMSQEYATRSADNHG